MTESVLYRLMSVAMMHYEYFVNIYKCVYNTFWILAEIKCYSRYFVSACES